MCMMYALQRTKKLRVVEILDIFAWEHYTSTALSTFIGVPPLQQNVRGVTLGGGLPPGVTLQQSGPGTVLGGGMPPGVTLQQSEPGTVFGGGMPPGVTLQQREPGTVLGGGMPPGVTLQQSESGIVLGGGLPPVRMEECPPALRYSRAALYNSVLPPREQVRIYLY